MNIKAYLERINYYGPLAPTAETLKGLQIAHLLAVPFENLSIHARQPIVLEDEALFTKIVEHRRGGFCYEANGLFAALLRALGFDVTMLSAEVAREDGGFGPAFDHMTLMVRLEQRWLVDVVLGDLNDVAWSRTNYLFQDISGLLDPRIGRGFYHTFHAKYPFIRFPLDHFFHSNHFRLVDFRRLAYFGSDHFPVYIKLSCEPTAESRQQELQANKSEQEEAEEKIEKAK